VSRGRHRKRFECGHRGFGKFCNRCKMAEQVLGKAKRLRKGTAKRNELLIQSAKLKGAGEDPTKADLEALGVAADEAEEIVRPPRHNPELDTC
jgi:hypothetical protein